MSIGTPGQKLKVAIDTGSDELWVNPDCSSPDLTSGQAQECFANEEYQASKSSTSDKLGSTSEIKYGKGYVELAYYKDTIALPDSTLKVTEAQFGVATASEELNEGILGLGFGEGFNLDYPNLIDDLASQKLIDTKAFSVALGSVDEDNGGTLIFGGVDTKKFTGPLVSNPILKPQNGEDLYRYWVEMTSVALTKGGSTSTYSGTNLPVVLDSGSSLSYLPASVVRNMASDLNGDLDQSGLYLVSCSLVDDDGSVDFAFGDITIKVPFKEFIWQFDSSTCILGAVPVDSSSGITALLGDTFMRSAFVVFDQSEKTISMAQYVNCGEDEQPITSGSSNFTGQCGAPTSNKENAAGKSTRSSAALVGGLMIGAVMCLL